MQAFYEVQKGLLPTFQTRNSFAFEAVLILGTFSLKEVFDIQTR